MRRVLALGAAVAAVIAVIALTPASAQAASTTLYVATNGSDSNAGTLAAPLKTIQKAVGLIAAGGTIAIRGGTFTLATNITIGKSGTSGAPITMTNYQGEHVIIDGEPLPYTPGAVGSTIPSAQRGAIHMSASYWRLSGLEIVHGPYAIYCDGCSNNLFDRLSTHDNYETGFQLQGSSANNQIVNLDSHDNRDPRKNGESADGLGIKQGSGAGNVVRGARLWNNADDGFDAWEFSSPITIQRSVAYGNGYNRWNLPNYSGDGNGFKLGGSGGTGPAAAHSLSNVMAWGNSAHGFTDNGNTGSIVVDRCTAYQNAKTGFDFDGGSTARLTANLALGNHTAVALGSSSASGNSWNIGGSWPLQSTDPSTVTGPRAADGSIPPSNYLVPANGAAVGANLSSPFAPSASPLAASLVAPLAASLTMRGADVSSLQRAIDVGAQYFTAAGVAADPLDILKSAGVDYVRLRVWNNPASGYNNAAKVLTFARTVKAKGFKLLVDFHYSDTWADPGKQVKPAAWASHPIGTLTGDVYAFTYNLCSSLKAQGTTPDSVQIGNEINVGMLWNDGKVVNNDFTNLSQLLKAGYNATKACNSATQVVIHTADADSDAHARWFYDGIAAKGVPWDITGLSYYCNWHGTMANMTSVVADVRSRYGKPVVIAETAAPFTLNNADRTGNSITSACAGYPATWNGQGAAFAAVQAAAKAGGAIGVFYWEPTWTAVPGNGWDPADIGNSGDGWDNMAVFNWTGVFNGAIRWTS